MRKFTIITIFALFLTQSAIAQFSSIKHFKPLTISTNTREKPQSKVWIHDGKHFSVLSNNSGAQVFRLDGDSIWTKVLTLTSASSQHADCKVVGNVVHIFLFQGNSSDLVSIEYVPTNSTYKRWTGRTSTVSVSTDSDAETATIDIDSNGRMWMAYDDASSIKVRWSNSPYSSWSSPITVASGITADDIGAVVAFPMFNKIGVLWSNQNTKRFGFKLHTDGATPGTWSSDELPASQSALNVGAGMGDDHVNMKVASDGTLYCAVKTSYDTPGYTKISLLIRRPAGTWDKLYKVSEIGTRGIVVLNEQVGKIRIIYSSSEDDGDILYKESDISSVAFGPQLTLISGEYNNSTSIKNPYTGQVVILASSTTRAVGVLATDAGTAPTPQLASPANNATGVAIAPTLSWSATANTTSYQMQLATSSDFLAMVSDITNITTLSAPISGLAYSTKYYWRVRAVNASGTSTWSTVRNFKTGAFPIPAAPMQDLPTNNATAITLPAVLSWNATLNAASYRVQISTSTSFSTPLKDVSNITTLNTSISGLNYSTKYYWRVRAVNISGSGSWSSTRNFMTGAIGLPGPPTLASPADNATGLTTSTTLSWNAGAYAASYQVQVATSSNFLSPVFDVNNITSLNTLVGGLAYSTPYFWRVRTNNASGSSNWTTPQSFSTGPQPPTLVAHWEMEGIGTGLTDNSSNANHATTSGSPTRITGIYGQALQLNGTSQYATAPSSASLNVSNAVTLAAWIKPEQTGTAQIVMKKGETGNADGYELSLTSTGKISFRYNQVSAGDAYRVNSNTLHPTNGSTWMHIAATFDGTTIKIYVDGNLDKTQTLTSPPPINSNSLPLAIGAQSSGGSRLQGAIDDARIYNVALSAGEISSLASTSSSRMASEPQTPLEATPNPFITASKIDFKAPETGEYAVILYNMAGNPVRVLKQGKAKAGEKLSVTLDGFHLHNGLYQVRLQTDKSSQTLKIIRN